MDPNIDAARASREVRIAMGIVTAWLPPYFAAWSDRSLAEQARAHVDFMRFTEGDYSLFKGQFALTMIALEKLAKSRGATSENMLEMVSEIVHEINGEFPCTWFNANH